MLKAPRIYLFLIRLERSLLLLASNSHWPEPTLDGVAKGLELYRHLGKFQVNATVERRTVGRTTPIVGGCGSPRSQTSDLYKTRPYCHHCQLPSPTGANSERPSGSNRAAYHSTLCKRALVASG